MVKYISIHRYFSIYGQVRYTEIILTTLNFIFIHTGSYVDVRIVSLLTIILQFCRVQLSMTSSHNIPKKQKKTLKVHP